MQLTFTQSSYRVMLLALSYYRENANLSETNYLEVAKLIAKIQDILVPTN